MVATHLAGQRRPGCTRDLPARHSQGRVGWRTARIAAGLGGLRLLPQAAPPKPVQDVVARYVPTGGRYAVMRATHPQRFVTLVVDRAGRPIAVAKVALSADGQRALEREATALAAHGMQLPLPLRAPVMIAHEPEILVTKAVEWQLRPTPWKLPLEVAGALGVLFRASEDAGFGVAHGDCAPWNLLWSAGAWVLVDWEDATAKAPAFHDVFHYLIQSHVLLGRPAANSILDGLSGRGWVGAAIRTYASAAQLPAQEAIDLFLGHLERVQPHQDPNTAPRRIAAVAHHRLRSAAEEWAARREPRPAAAP
jgi:Phosphotransferase enzyme family